MFEADSKSYFYVTICSYTIYRISFIVWFLFNYKNQSYSLFDSVLNVTVIESISYLYQFSTRPFLCSGLDNSITIIKSWLRLGDGIGKRDESVLVIGSKPCLRSYK